MAKAPTKPRVKKADAVVENIENLTSLQALFSSLMLVGKNVAHQHCAIRGGYVTMWDGVACIGAQGPLGHMPTDCNPNLNLLATALARCKVNPVFEYNDQTQRLKIKSGKFTAHVPCLTLDLVAFQMPDTPQATLGENGEKLLKAIAVTGELVQEAAARLMQCSIFVGNTSCSSTDGAICFEYWHGQNMPDMTLPKATAQVLASLTKTCKFTDVGASFNSFGRCQTVTFWFGRTCFLRSQLYVEESPDFNTLFTNDINPWPIAAGLWEGLEAVSPFVTEQGKVILRGNQVRVGDSDEDGAQFEIDGTLPELSLSHKRLSQLAPYATHVDWNGSDKVVHFRGDNFRAVLAKRDDV